MSSRVVRDTVRGWLADRSMVVPFVDTINRDQDPSAAPMWCTARFNAYTRERLTFCADVMVEEGDIEIVYFGQAGVGDGVLLPVVEGDVMRLMARRDPAYRLILDEAGAPEEFFGGSASRYYGVSVTVRYSFYSN